ncbi:MAG TPA: ABC transporter permease [Bryobacteraceae bacterium]|jgi:ABC-2 type transport system permease protein|nr:ABC transporter permease [Bryobacteraceae bacterium]
MRERIFAIITKELSQLFRNRRTRMFLFVPPMFQLIIFGYAVNLDVDNLRMGWMDMDQSPQSHDLLASFQGSGRFLLTALPQSEKDIQNVLDRGDAQVIVRVLPGFGRDILLGHPTSAQILVDGTNSNTASLASAYTSQLVGAYSASVATPQLQSRMMARAGMGTMSLKVGRITDSARVWFNPDLKSRNYFVPGVICNLIMVVTVMLTAMAIVREKEIGTMEQLMVTPIRPMELMIGKMVPAALVGLMDLVLMTTAALLIFTIPFRGNPLVLLASALLFLLTSLGMGLFISTIASTQQQAIMSSSLIAIPTFMLSGFAYPIRNMPIAVQYFTYLNPLRYLIEIVRGIFLKGTGVSVLWPQMLTLLVYGMVVMGLSATSFRKKLD